MKKKKKKYSFEEKWKRKSTRRILKSKRTSIEGTSSQRSGQVTLANRSPAFSD